MLYKLIYQRSPTEVEMKLAIDYIRSDRSHRMADHAQSAWEYGYGEYNAATKRTKLFVPLGNFVNKSWQPGGKTPDAKLRGLSLGAEAESRQAFRGDSPLDVTSGWIHIDRRARLVHAVKDGDGVQEGSFSSRLGLAGSWVAYNSRRKRNFRASR